MESIALPTFPNIPGLKMQLLSEMFLVVSLILVLGFLLWYGVVKYRGRRKLSKQLHHFQFQAARLNKEILFQNIKNSSQSSDKHLLVLFVEYLERFTTNMPYSSLEQLFGQHGFGQEEVSSMMKVMYQGGPLNSKIKDKILRLKIDPSFIG